MNRFSTLAIVLVLAACSETPTSPPLPPTDVSSGSLAVRGSGERASVTTIDLDQESCDTPVEGTEICFAQTGRLHVVETPSGMTSFSVVDARLVVDFLEDGVVVRTVREQGRIHELFRDGNRVQFHQRLCQRVDAGDLALDFGFIVNVANGVERQYVETTSGCRF